MGAFSWSCDGSAKTLKPSFRLATNVPKQVAGSEIEPSRTHMAKIVPLGTLSDTDPEYAFTPEVMSSCALYSMRYNEEPTSHSRFYSDWHAAT